MIKTITINEAAQILNYKKLCSVEKWCQENKVIILALKGCRKKQVVQLQFEHARLKKFIEHLKIKYQGKWLEAFRAYIQFDIIRIVELEEEGVSSQRTSCIQDSKMNNYQPLEYELKILSRLTE